MSTAPSLLARLEKLGPDVLEAFEYLVSRVEKGAALYGPLVLSNNPRDWDAEQLEELADATWYRAFARVRARRGAP